MDVSKIDSIISKIESFDENSKAKNKPKSEVIADRVAQRWSGNGKNGRKMQVIDIKLQCKGNDSKKLSIKLKAHKITKELLSDLPNLVEKFF